MAKKKSTKTEEKETAKKKTTTKKKEEKFTLIDLCKKSTMPDAELILRLADTGYLAEYKRELRDGAEPSWTEKDFIEKILRSE